MTLQQAAQQAVDACTACNLSGVVHSFSRIMKDVLWPEANRLGKGTDWVNHHPVSVMFADAIHGLAKAEGRDLFAYDVCCRIAAGETVECE